MEMDDVFLAASEYMGIIGVPITLITVAALADEIILLTKRSVLPYVRRRK